MLLCCGLSFYILLGFTYRWSCRHSFSGDYHIVGRLMNVSGFDSLREHLFAYRDLLSEDIVVDINVFSLGI